MSAECAVGDRLIVDTEQMSNGPHAIARHRGLVVFVRGGAPGERVEVEVRERHRSHAFADVVAVERAGSARRAPACALAGRCGGCPWQHLDYRSQLEAKQQIVADQLARIGGIDDPVSPVLASPRVYGYRHRLKLRVEGGRIGFYAGASHDLVGVAHCALAESPIETMLAPLEELAGLLGSDVRRLEIAVSDRVAGRVVISGEVHGRWPATDSELCQSWMAAHPQCAGLTMRGRGWSEGWGDPLISLEPVAGVVVGHDAPGFSQVNTLANRLLVQTVLDWAEPRAGRVVIDAYAGAGNFSAPLAERGARVTAIEQSKAACRAARRNSRRGAGWRVECQRVEVALSERAGRGERVDLVLLDPPRSGAARAIAPLLRMAPPEVIYVSCDPATLARDLAALVGAYEIAAIQPIDMFPHTYHVETVVRCRRR